jgi:teichuronic acid biosynthesis glycosyltransferase TuaG
LTDNLVDIILPLYKPDNKVYLAIESVLLQSFTNWYLYIIDDASFDDSMQKISVKFASYTDRIKFIQMNHNNRAASCRNFAINLGHGKYVSFIDQDDIWVREKLLLQVDYIEKTGYDAVHGNVKYLNDSGNIIMDEKCEQENNSRREIKWNTLSVEELSNSIIAKPNIRLISSMIKRESFIKIGGFRDRFFGGEDEIFWFEIAQIGKIGYQDNVMFYRTIHEKNTSSFYSIPRTIGYIKALKFLKTITNRRYSKVIDQKIKSKYYTLVRISFKMKMYPILIKTIIILFLKDPKFLVKQIITSILTNIDHQKIVT